MSNYIRRCRECKEKGLLYKINFNTYMISCPACSKETKEHKHKTHAVKEWREMNKKKQLNPIMQTILWACGWIKERW